MPLTALLSSGGPNQLGHADPSPLSPVTFPWLQRTQPQYCQGQMELQSSAYSPTPLNIQCREKRHNRTCRSWQKHKSHCQDVFATQRQCQTYNSVSYTYSMSTKDAPFPFMLNTEMEKGTNCIYSNAVFWTKTQRPFLCSSLCLLKSLLSGLQCWDYTVRRHNAKYILTESLNTWRWQSIDTYVITSQNHIPYVIKKSHFNCHLNMKSNFSGTCG